MTESTNSNTSEKASEDNAGEEVNISFTPEDVEALLNLANSGAKRAKKTVNKAVNNVSSTSTRVIKRGNNWLRAIALVLILWPVAPLALSALGASQWVIATVSLIVPVVALLMVLLKWPIVTVASASIPGFPRKALGAIFLAISYELIAGLYFSVVPIENERELIPVFILVVAALVTLSLAKGLMGIKSGSTKFLSALLFIFAFVITLGFFAGGWEELGEALEDSSISSQQGVYETPETVPFRRDGERFIHEVTFVSDGECSALVDLRVASRTAPLVAGYQNHWDVPKGTIIHSIVNGEDVRQGPAGVHREEGDEMGIGGFICFSLEKDVSAEEWATVWQVPIVN